MGAGGAWQAINFTRDESSVERRALEQLADKQVLGSIQRGWRSVSGGDLGDACMKASGEGAGTKAGLGVEESRTDTKTQERHTTRKKSFDLTCFNSIPSPPRIQKKGPRDTCECKGACASSVRGVGKREADLL